MQSVKRFLVAGIAAASTTGFLTAAAHAGSAEPVKPVAEGLNGPFQVSAETKGRLLVTESDIGQITRVNPRTGAKKALVTDVPGASGAVRYGKYIAIVTGEIPEAPSGVAGSSVLLAKPGKAPFRIADLLRYELKHNPDGQIQFDENGEPVDALSNPFNIVRDRSGKGRFIVADAGANAVLRIGWHGKVSTLFLPKVVRTGVCATAENNTVDGFGCDPVPTGLAYGPRGKLYVSTLGAEAPGAGRVYVISPRTGKVFRTIKGLDSPTGVAVSPRGTVYVSNVIEGAPEGEPGPEFDPSTVGDITRITPHGHRSTAQVTMPTGMLWQHGKLYSSAWSVAGLFLQIPDAGQVVRVSQSAFK